MLFGDLKRVFLIVQFARLRLPFACAPLDCDTAGDGTGATTLLQSSLKIAGHAIVANDTVRTTYAATAASVAATRTPQILSYNLVSQRFGTDERSHTALRLQTGNSSWKPAQQILACGKGVVCVCFIVLLLTLLYSVCVGLPGKELCNIKPEDNHMPMTVQCYLMTYAFLLSIVTDQYLPSLPTMLKEFNTDEQVMSFSVQVNWMTKAFTSLLVGVASDRLGRKRLLLGGNAVMVAATFGCCCATDINWFIVCRILQGLGESVYVIVFATIRDYLPDDEKRAALMGLIIALIPIGPAIAPVFGGFMANSFGWRLSFLFLACALALALCCGLFCLEESSPDVTGKRTVSEDALAVSQDRHLMTLLISSATLGASIMTVVSNVPYVIENEYGKNILVTTWFLAAMAMSAVLGGVFVPSCMPASNLQSSKIALGIVAVGAALVAAVAFSLTQHFESIFCLLLQNAVLLTPYIYLSTMAYAPAANFAGILAAFEGCFGNIAMALMSMLGTKMTSLYGTKGLMLTAAGVAMGGNMIFWAGFGCDPPTWALKDDEKHETSAKETASDSLREENPAA